MRWRLTYSATFAVLIIGLAGCGSDGGNGGAGDAVQAQAQPPSPFAVLAFKAVTLNLGDGAAPSPEQAACLTTQLTDRLGADRLADLGALATNSSSSDWWEVTSNLWDITAESRSEAMSVVDAVLACGAAPALLSGASQDQLDCLAPVLEGSGLRDIVTAVITDDYPAIRNFHDAANICTLRGVVGL
ncbi:MAG: hypothetical protein KJ698_03245 [Actinobacteria bacterium]|nr:hypothetical protein [Actinomycetota bacterium]MBU1492394.1 hypothetical protein [Actinomycetota bacterium]MBU1865961.1 hypothetical protein [Actinomycetota bacterium]